MAVFPAVSVRTRIRTPLHQVLPANSVRTPRRHRITRGLLADRSPRRNLLPRNPPEPSRAAPRTKARARDHRHPLWSLPLFQGSHLQLALRDPRHHCRSLLRSRMASEEAVARFFYYAHTRRCCLGIVVPLKRIASPATENAM